MGDFLNFRKMLTPVIIKIVFWLGIVATVLGGLIAFQQSALQGILIVLLGPVLVRIYCELLIVIFSINDTLNDINKKLDRGNNPPV
jgi:hypothetical protein